MNSIKWNLVQVARFCFSRDGRTTGLGLKMVWRPAIPVGSKTLVLSFLYAGMPGTTRYLALVRKNAVYAWKVLFQITYLFLHIHLPDKPNSYILQSMQSRSPYAYAGPQHNFLRWETVFPVLVQHTCMASSYIFWVQVLFFRQLDTPWAFVISEMQQVFAGCAHTFRLCLVALSLALRTVYKQGNT